MLFPGVTGVKFIVTPLAKEMPPPAITVKVYGVAVFDAFVNAAVKLTFPAPVPPVNAVFMVTLLVNNSVANAEAKMLAVDADAVSVKTRFGAVPVKLPPDVAVADMVILHWFVWALVLPMPKSKMANKANKGFRQVSANILRFDIKEEIGKLKASNGSPCCFEFLDPKKAVVFRITLKE